MYVFDREDGKVEGWRVNYHHALIKKSRRVEKWVQSLRSGEEKELWAKAKNSPNPILLPSSLSYQTEENDIFSSFPSSLNL